MLICFVTVVLKFSTSFTDDEDNGNRPPANVAADVAAEPTTVPAPEEAEQTSVGAGEDIDRLPLMALPKGKEIEKRKGTESPSRRERRTKQRHDVLAPGTLSEVVAVTTGKSLGGMAPLNQSHPIDAHFGVLAILDEFRKVLEGKEQNYTRTASRNTELRRECDAARNALTERDLELSQLKEELASRDKVIAENEKILAIREKEVQDARTALDAGNKGHGDMLKAFFCKLITTDDFSKFDSLLATIAFGEVQKQILDNVMRKHPELNIRDPRQYGYIDPTPEEIVAEYSAKVLSSPTFSLLEVLMKKAEDGPLTQEIIQECEVPLDANMVGKAVNSGAGHWGEAAAGPSSHPPVDSSSDKAPNVGN